MESPPSLEERQLTTRPLIYNGQFYSWCKTRMHDFIIEKDSELWYIICDGPYVPIETTKKGDTS